MEVSLAVFERSPAGESGDPQSRPAVFSKSKLLARRSGWIMLAAHSE
jgi:hypothetical protein